MTEKMLSQDQWGKFPWLWILSQEW